jgi:prepilin-type N-terminal cleavage/methylation domain-containing protein
MKGYTLIELLIVVLIVSLIAVMTSVFYSRFLVQNSVDDITDTIVQNLRKAQLYAMESRKSETQGWGVKFSVGRISVYLGNSYASRTLIWDENVLINGGATVSAFEVNFMRLTGTPSATPTINITGKNITKSVTLTAQGMIGRI